MATSRIEITFTKDLLIGDRVYFEKRYNDGSLQSIWHPVDENWVNLRSSSNQVTTGTPTLIEGERSAINFAQAVGLDYNLFYNENGNSINGVSRVGNKVIIKLDSFWNFRLIEPNPTDESVIIEIFNFESPVFIVDSVQFLEADVNPKCTHYSVQVTANQTIDNYTVNNGALIDSDSTVVTFEVLRSQPLTSTFFSEDSQEHSINYSITNAPSILDVNNLNIQVVASPNGGTATATLESTLTLEYSLDDVIWQESEVFSGLAQGNYTLYVRDNLGCKINKEFFVDAFGITEPHVYISKSNSIRFSKLVEWGNCGNYKNNENTLSCQENVRKSFEYTQLFQTCDIIPTQIQSNYAVNSMKIIDENDVETNVSFVQKSNFMNRSDKRDARRYNFGNGKTGIYFTLGSVYDYDTGAETGSYTLNGNLPEWGVEGNYIAIGTSWFIIEQIRYVPEKNADVIIISNTYTGIDELMQVSSIYNIDNFEVFESSIDFDSFINKKLRVYISLTDANFEDVNYISELIHIKERHENTSLLRYKNSTNTDVFYNTGIDFKLRLEIEDIYADDDENSEVNITDTQSKIYQANIYERNTFEWHLLSTEIMRKVKQALVHDTLEIDGVPYTKNENPEVLNEAGTNLYSITAVMIKAGKNFSSNSSLGGFEFSGSVGDIPNLIDFEGGFVEY